MQLNSKNLKIELNKVTIIILTHYSDRDASRILDYYRDVVVNILVADSCIVPFPFYKQYKNVCYFHYPNMSLSEKMAAIFHYVATPYVLLCPDDDFIVPSGIISCIEFLERHQDYAAVQGQFVSFTAERSDITMGPLYIGSEGLDIKSVNTAERVKLSMHPYMHWFYSVHRTENLKFFFQDIHSQIPIGAMGEVAMTLISAISGNLKMLPVFYAARDSYQSPSRLCGPSIIESKNRPELKGEYDIFLSLVIDYFCDKTGSSQIEGRRCVEQAIEAYTHYYISKRTVINFEISENKTKIKKIIRQYLPEFVRYYRGLRLYRLIGNTQGYPFFDLKAKNDWQIIKSVIIKHNRP